MVNLPNARNYDEGLGTVYERFMLNDFFDSITCSTNIRNVLEVPIYGMTGLTGINSVHFAEKGCNVTLVGTNDTHVEEAACLWKELPYADKYKIIKHVDMSRLPFEDGSFDLVWNFAALWHVRQAKSLLSEIARVASGMVLIFMPNRRQAGYLLRKHFFDRDFFGRVDEKWADMGLIRSLMASLGLEMKAQGVLDVPPWPDTCFPIGPYIRKIFGSGEGQADRWTWDIMRYYNGRDEGMKRKIDKFAFLERMAIPWWVKSVWAHHRFAIFSKY